MNHKQCCLFLFTHGDSHLTLPAVVFFLQIGHHPGELLHKVKLLHGILLEVG